MSEITRADVRGLLNAAARSPDLLPKKSEIHAEAKALGCTDEEADLLVAGASEVAKVASGGLGGIAQARNLSDELAALFIARHEAADALIEQEDQLT